MPSNAQTYTDLYVSSVEQRVNLEAEEAKSILVEEMKDNRAYIESIQDQIGALDDDIRSWTQLGGDVDRAERRLLLDQQRHLLNVSKERRRGARSSATVTRAFDDLRNKFSRTASGRGERGGVQLARAMGRSRSEDAQAMSLVQSFGTETDLGALILKENVGRESPERTRERALASGMGIYDALKERAQREGIRVSDGVLRKAAAGMVGLWGPGVQDQSALLNEGMYNQARQAVVTRTRSRSSSQNVSMPEAVSAELQASGFALDDILPTIEAMGLIDRRSALQQQLQQAQAQRVQDVEAELDRRILERTEGVGEGLPFVGRGFVGMMQFQAEGRQRREELAQRQAQNQSQRQFIDSLNPNERMLLRATGHGISSFQRHGVNRPPEVSDGLWSIGSQLATMAKAGGFADNNDIVVKARAMVNQLGEAEGVSPQVRDNMLGQALEFFVMQRQADFPEPVQAPVEEEAPDPVDAALERGDPDARRRNQADNADREGQAADARRDEDEADAQEEVDTRQAAAAGREGQPLGFSRQDLMALRRMVDSISRAEDLTNQRFGRPNSLEELQDRLEQLQEGVADRVASLTSRGLAEIGGKIAGVSERNAPIRGEDPGFLRTGNEFEEVITSIKRARMQLLLFDMLRDAGPIQDGEPRTTLSLPDYLNRNPDKMRHIAELPRTDDIPEMLTQATEIIEGPDRAALFAEALAPDPSLVLLDQPEQDPSLMFDADLILQQMFEREERRERESDVRIAERESEKQLLESFGVPR